MSFINKKTLLVILSIVHTYVCVRELWRQEATIDQSLQSSRDELTRLERNLRATVSKSTNRGLDAVKKIAEERQLSGVYGPLIDNFVLKKEEAAVAVDVTAGNRFVIAVCASLNTSESARSLDGL